jgi:hypothetical protein
MVTRMSYGGPHDPRTPLDEPKQVFARLFGDTLQTQAEIDALHARRKSVLDAVLGEFNSVNATLGYDDRQKLERHATAIRDLEHQLDITSTPGLACNVPSMPPTASVQLVDCMRDDPPRPTKCLSGFPEIGKAQMDLVVLALACDLTRVATLQWSTAESTIFHKWLNVKTEHHLMTHDAKGYRADLIKIETWYAQQFAKLLDALKSHTDADGTTLLDSAIVLWPNELSEAQSHDRRNLNWVLAGKGNGALRTGRYLKLTGNTTNQVFASLMTMFGAPTQTFGDPKFKGTLPGLI